MVPNLFGIGAQFVDDFSAGRLGEQGAHSYGGLMPLLMRQEAELWLQWERWGEAACTHDAWLVCLLLTS